MQRDRLSTSLLPELFDLEEDTYRVSIREAKRIRRGPPATALHAIAGHAAQALVEVQELGRGRDVRLSSPTALALDMLRRARDIVMDQLVDHEHGYRRALTTSRRGLDLVRLTHAAAHDEGDTALAAWCLDWTRARERLVADAADQLDWFGRRPFFARLPAAKIPSVP